MKKPITIIHNAETGEVVEREMTAKELAQLAIDEASFQANKEAEAVKAAKKATAQAKLAALGLTTDDLKALGL